jgi:hypothetical protein
MQGWEAALGILQISHRPTTREPLEGTVFLGGTVLISGLGHKPKIFVSHCERTPGPTEFSCRLIDLMGCIPVLAEAEPKFTRPVSGVVHGGMDECDAAIVLLTPDDNVGGHWHPSGSVTVEVGNLQTHPTLKGRFLVLKEESVELPAMQNETYTVFKPGNYGPIATALLSELGALGLFINHHAMAGSDFPLQGLADMASNIRGLARTVALDKETLDRIIDQAGETFKVAIRQYMERKQ